MKVVKKTLKDLINEAEFLLNSSSFDKAYEVYLTITNKYPKNKKGYIGIIYSMSENFTRCIDNSDIKFFKETYDKAYQLSNKREKDKLEKDTKEYFEDLREVENLCKLKKDIVSNQLLKNAYKDGISYANQKLDLVSKYNYSGKKITNVYDLIRGIFFIVCLIYNIIFRNYLLVITIPFGIMGIITVYSFLNENFLKRGILKSEKNIFEDAIKNANKKILDLKTKVDNISNDINLLLEKKKDLILKIPSSFSKDLIDLIDNNEEEISINILNELTTNNIAGFTYLVDENTNFDAPELINKIQKDIMENSNLDEMLSSKEAEKKNIQNEIVLIKKVKTAGYILVGLMMLLSILSFWVVIHNFDEFIVRAFILAMASGIISIIVYNINTGKHKALIDTVNDNLLSSIFKIVLVYDLVYESIVGYINFKYAFIQIPIIFILIFIGPISLVSLLKYNNYIKKLRG